MIRAPSMKGGCFPGAGNDARGPNEDRLPMTAEPQGEITRILHELENADRREVLHRLLPLVYDELRELAKVRLRYERSGHSLQPTALVHEAYMRILAGDGPTWNDRRHFYRTAAQAMRRILIEHARRRERIKRGGDRVQVTLGDVQGRGGPPLEDILSLDEAIGRLERLDARMAEVVRLRFFAGLSVAEAAEVLEVSERTVKRDWAVARAWLYDALREK